MSFEGGKSKFKIQSLEGVFLSKDGRPGDGFIEISGRVLRTVKLSETISTYAAEADAHELASLGFPPDASGRHVLIKVITNEDGVETHRVTRVSTITWKDSAQMRRALQFVSLQGFHKRQP